MSWQDVELRAYESRRQEQALRSEHLMLRNRLVQAQGSGRWADLLGQFRSAVITFNSLKDGGLLRETNSPVTHYEIEREDGVSLSVDYDRDLNRVTCSIPSSRMEDWGFELEVHGINGNDKTVWVDRQTGQYLKDEKIAEMAIKRLLIAKA